MLQLLHTCTIQRNQPVGTNGRHELADLATGVPCLELPMALNTAVTNGWSIGKAYDIYFNEGQDVKPGDKITLGSDTYSVKGVQTFTVPVVGHKRALCVQEAN